MYYVIFNPTTFKTHENRKTGKKFHASERLAKAARTKAALNPAEWEVIDHDKWISIEIPMVERISAFDGKTKVMVRADQVGTCVDPGMESYWCN